MCPAASARFTYKMNTSDVGRGSIRYIREKRWMVRGKGKRREKRRDAGKQGTGGD